MSPNRDRLFPLCLYLFSFLLQIVYLLEIKSNPFFNLPVLDEAIHLRWANALARGEPWFPGEPYFRAPLYPLFLSFLFRIGGAGVLFPRIVQAAIGALGPVLLYRLGRRLFPSTTAAVAAILLALNGMALYFQASFLIVSILIPLDLAVLLLLARSADRPERAALWLGAGVLLGLSAVARPNILLFGAAVPFWAFALDGRPARTLRRAVLPFLLGAALPIAPVALHNLAAGEPVWIAWQGGINFYIGNNPGSDGMTAIAPGADGTWWGGYRDMIRFAEESEGKPLSRRGVSAYWTGRAFAFFRDDPGGAARLFARKAFLLVNDFEVSNNQGIYFFRRFSRILAVLMHLGWGILFPLAAAGAVFIRWDRRRALPALFFLVYGAGIVLFFVTARYRMPLLPVLLLPAATALVEWPRRIRRNRDGRLALSLVLFAGAALLSNWNPLGLEKERYAQGYYNAGAQLLLAGRFEEAIPWFGGAIEEEPAYRNARYNLGLCYSYLNRLDDAERELRTVAREHPDFADGRYALGAVLERLGRPEEAVAEAVAALRLRPDMEAARLLLARAAAAADSLKMTGGAVKR
ncbi:MAG: glycosyltransferase family 39 protein [Candidatus Eisenbacteria bacterium]|nr:glycosyltransferase family 39 protein [Candidatus Eisenbacteria bacterium]